MVGRYRAYPEYKPSGVEWLGDVPKHWDVSTRIKFTSSLKGRLGWQGLKADEYIEEGPYVVSSAHFSEHKIQWDTCPHVSPERYELDRNIQLAEGDLLLMKDGAAMGKLAYVDNLPDKACLNSHLLLFRPRNSKNEPSYDTKFMYYFMQTDFFQGYIKVNGTGATFLGISQQAIGNFRLVFPSLIEQSQISAFLDHETGQIDALIAKQQRLIALLEEKRQAVISHAVTKGLNPSAPLRPSGIDWLGDVPAHWEVKRLKYLGDAWNGLTYSPDDVVPEGEGTLVLRSSNIQSARLAFHDNVYVKGRIPKKVRVIEGDLLICSRNGSRALIGKNAQITSDLEGSAFGAFMCIFRSEMNDYLSVVLNSTLFEFQSGTFLTSTINQLTTGNLLSFEIPLPPAEERAIIVNFSSQQVAKFNELLDKAQSAITLLKERRTALISAAVTGKIDLRDWRPPASATARTADISKDEFA